MGRCGQGVTGAVLAGRSTGARGGAGIWEQPGMPSEITGLREEHTDPGRPGAGAPAAGSRVGSREGGSPGSLGSSGLGNTRAAAAAVPPGGSRRLCPRRELPAPASDGPVGGGDRFRVPPVRVQTGGPWAAAWPRYGRARGHAHLHSGLAVLACGGRGCLELAWPSRPHRSPAGGTQGWRQRSLSAAARPPRVQPRPGRGLPPRHVSPVNHGPAAPDGKRSSPR